MSNETTGPDWQSLTEATLEAVEKARAALDEFARAWKHATGPQASDEKETVTSDDVIEQAARALCTLDHGNPDELLWDCDDCGRVTTAEFAWTEYVDQARDLDAAGLLARPLPDRDNARREIAEALATASGWPGRGDKFLITDGLLDAVLALLEGADG